MAFKFLDHSARLLQSCMGPFPNLADPVEGESCLSLFSFSLASLEI